MKARKLAIWPWLICQYSENTLKDHSSFVFGANHFLAVKFVFTVRSCVIGNSNSKLAPTPTLESANLFSITRDDSNLFTPVTK